MNSKDEEKTLHFIKELMRRVTNDKSQNDAGKNGTKTAENPSRVIKETRKDRQIEVGS